MYLCWGWHDSCDAPVPLNCCQPACRKVDTPDDYSTRPAARGAANVNGYSPRIHWAAAVLDFRHMRGGLGCGCGQPSTYGRTIYLYGINGL